MQVLRLNRGNEAFYSVMGPVFGSRVVEQDTHDRFYDDPEKEWYVLPGQGAASVRDGSIRNFWAVGDAADGLLAAILADYPRISGIVPRRYETAFRRAGFDTSGYRVNFMEVRYVQGKDC